MVVANMPTTSLRNLHTQAWSLVALAQQIHRPRKQHPDLPPLQLDCNDLFLTPRVSGQD